MTQSSKQDKLQESIPCAKCSYSLLGLDVDGFCPECTHSIKHSVGEFANQKEQLPTWLCRLRMLYWVTWILAVAGAYTTISIDGGHGVGRIDLRGMFWFGVIAACVVPLVVVGAIVADSLFKRSRNVAAIVVIVSIVYAASFLIVPFLGRA